MTPANPGINPVIKHGKVSLRRGYLIRSLTLSTSLSAKVCQVVCNSFLHDFPFMSDSRNK